MICQFCSTEFQDRKHPGRKFCSKNCFAKFITKRLTKTCDYCGKEFSYHQFENERRFCCHACYSKSIIKYNDRAKDRPKRKHKPAAVKDKPVKKIFTGNIVKCEQCNEQFIAGYKGARFCCRKCFFEHRSTKLTLICLECSQFYRVAEGRKHLSKFCSKSCYYDYYRKHGRRIGVGGRKKTGKAQYSSFYATPEWEKIRRRIVKRDEHKCQCCGYIFNLHVHHLKPRRLFNGCLDKFHPLADTDDNLITVCRKCHNKIHNNQLSLKLPN